jgi:hypothetical protein
MLSGTGGGYLTNNAQWLVFDVIQTSTLNTVVMYAQAAGNRVVELRGANNAVINSLTVNLAQGTNTVTLSFPLTIGTNYRLGLSTTSTANLFRSNSGVTYPYNVGNCVNITTSSAGNGAYYWFYRWEVVKEDCTSPLVPVNVAVNPLPVVSLAASNTLVCLADVITLSGAPGGGNYTGPGVAGNLFAPSSLGPGTYTVNYSYTDANGCSDVASAQMIVSNCTGVDAKNAAAALSVFPNPAKDKIVLRHSLAGGSLNLSDASGRLVLMTELKGSEQEITLNALSRGLYIAQVKDQSGQPVATLKLVKE